MSAAVQRWERHRAAWLIGHSSAHGGAISATMRRRAEILERSARRSERAGSGITATAVQDEVSPALWHRLTRDTDGSRHHRPRWVLAATAVAIFAGLGLLVGHGIYRLMWRTSPSIGRLWAWPWAAVGMALALALALCGIGFRPIPHFDRHWPLTALTAGPWWALAGWQLVIAALTVASLIPLWGWRGVPARAVGAPIRNRDGTFREVSEADKLALDPWKGEPQQGEDPDRTQELSAYEKWEASAQREADLGAIYDEVSSDDDLLDDTDWQALR
ncbi:hypothetical protein ACFUEJ_10685 [Gordonia sp. NPDC057258]|uniref:hypothetical protein n=1 Tax=unclassified Gordonia (in: high G+C Gram-positive bacteria) TaxID=2657482 RepID=UPI00362584A2